MTTPDAAPAAEVPPGRRYRLRPRTLRGRLIAGLVTLLIVACAGVGAATYVVLSHTLINQLSRQVFEANQRYSSCLEAPGPEADHGRQPVQSPSDGDHDNDNFRGAPQQCGKDQGEQTFTAAIVDHQVRFPAVANGACHLTQSDKAKLLALTSHHPTIVTLSALGPYQVMASPGPDQTVLVTGMPLSLVDSTLQQVELAEIVVFSAAVLLTGVIGTGFVRLSLRPLRRVAATAARVAQLPLASGEVTLSERVPDANPRTEVGQVGSAFNRMLGHVEGALARRAASEARLRRFAADASHELRTPLAAIRGYAELALRHPGPVPPDIEHALRRVESESARMGVLVDELLLLAQLDAGRPLAREPVDLTRLAIDATSDARAAAARHRWQLELPGEPVLVRGDEHRLHQVLANLMSNAAKHTPPGTTVTIALADGPPPGPGGQATIELSVTDNGPGIPPDLQPTLFERFVRGDTTRSHQAGQPPSTGLGLAIVDAVTTAHHGTVTLDSKPGHTRFTITLPRLEPLAAPQDGAAAQPAGWPPDRP